jgi:hypothetical protein
MNVHPRVTQQNNMILVSLQASFVGGPMDAVDKDNILAFGDPQVNLTGGQFVDNTAYSAVAAQALIQGITFTASTTGTTGNAVTISFVSVGSPDASAITGIGSNALVVDISNSTLSRLRTTAEIAALFTSGPQAPVSTTGGGNILAAGGSSTPATAQSASSLSGGAQAFTSAFSFVFPASDLYVGITTQMQGYTARFMTQLPPAPRGIPEQHWEQLHLRHDGHHHHGSLDCVTSDPQHAAQFWINSIESRISTLMTALRARTPLGSQTDATI